jgi:hypothetical protein
MLRMGIVPAEEHSVRRDAIERVGLCDEQAQEEHGLEIWLIRLDQPRSDRGQLLPHGLFKSGKQVALLGGLPDIGGSNQHIRH